MKTAVLFGLTLLWITPAFAQTREPLADQLAKTVTLTGCVGGGTDARPITLSQALIVPGTPQPGQLDKTPSPVPSPVSSTETEPPDPTWPPPTAAPVPALAPSPVGTSGTKSSSAAPGTTGVTGTAPTGSSGSSLSGYRLSGADLQPWIGKRVQLIGTFAPATTPSAPAPIGLPPAAGALPVLEFRVQTVVPATGACPKN